jgi:hypothetical protein
LVLFQTQVTQVLSKFTPCPTHMYL